MIFLKQNGYRGAVRVRQGADLLHDRAIEAGGWNYGEPAVLGGDLFPTDVPTAVALLALADERDDTAAAGLSWLLSRRGQISSLLSLGWVTIALNVLGVLDDDWRADVVDRWHALPERRGPRETALCLLGLSDTADHPLGVVSL
jgi:hypothetical protein